ncbi:hypothetical protein [Streptomyces sp. TBY4]|uniref:hypothetical protein n=1 Tax=Streptomyces sp. TBY4 TaxID=2962030 RepID=UPI0020B64C3C|nr:hypothetical protein [Streptomyces sp. TBY4]MCP3755226.1 hypothetical protein [Streptomyces sp. TBY4]
MPLRTFTGITGVAFTALQVVEVPLYFLHDGAPPDSNVLTRIMLSLLVLVLLLGFATGLRELVRRADPDCGWVADLAHGAALTYIAVTFVAHSLQAGEVIAAREPVDPTITAEGSYLLYGSVGRILTAVFLAAAGYAAVRSGLLSRWAARSAYALALINLAFVPSLYFGNDTGRFFSANGWGTTATIASLYAYWILAVGIALLRRRNARHYAGRAGSDSENRR